MVRALSACNSSSLTLYVYCKRRQNHFSMFSVVKNNCYKINSNLDHLPKQRWQIDAIGVLEGVIGEIMKLPEGCYIATAQGALYEYNEVEAPSGNREKGSLFSPGSGPQTWVKGSVLLSCVPRVGLWWEVLAQKGYFSCQSFSPSVEVTLRLSTPRFSPWKHAAAKVNALKSTLCPWGWGSRGGKRD